MEAEREHELLPPTGSKEAAALPSHDIVKETQLKPKVYTKSRLITKCENGQISIKNHYHTQNQVDLKLNDKGDNNTEMTEMLELSDKGLKQP